MRRFSFILYELIIIVFNIFARSQEHTVYGPAEFLVDANKTELISHVSFMSKFSGWMS
jgi:hypothetical protein